MKAPCKAFGAPEIKFLFSKGDVNVAPCKPVCPPADRKKRVVLTRPRRRPVMNVFPEPGFEQEKGFANRIKYPAVVLASNAHILREPFAFLGNPAARKEKFTGNPIFWN